MDLVLSGRGLLVAVCSLSECLQAAYQNDSLRANYCLRAATKQANFGLVSASFHFQPRKRAGVRRRCMRNALSAALQLEIGTIPPSCMQPIVISY